MIISFSTVSCFIEARTALPTAPLFLTLGLGLVTLILRTQNGKAAQPRSSEKNAASRAGQTPCTRWAVGICYTRAKSVYNGRESCLRREATLSFFTESRGHGGVKTSEARMWSWRRRWREGSQNTASIRFTGWGVRTRKTNFRCPQVEQQSPIATRPSSAVRLRKVVRPQPRSPAPRADPEGQFVYK